MTVVAYSSRHKVLAADSRLNDEFRMHLTNCRKIFRLANKALLGTAGDSDDRLVRDLLGRATPRKMPSRQHLSDTKTDFEGILVFPKGQVFVISICFEEREGGGEWRGAIDPISDELVAVGHGKQFAYGALEAGKTPVEAIRIACRRDTTCALPVQWERLEGDGEGKVILEEKHVGKKVAKR
jgi:hypothetical protein